MPVIENLIQLATVGSTFVNATMLHRFLRISLRLIVLTIIGAMLSGVCLIGIFYTAYLGLVNYGLSAAAASLSVSTFILIIVVGIFSIISQRVRALQEFPTPTLAHKMPGFSHIVGIVDAFAEGLLHPDDARYKTRD